MKLQRLAINREVASYNTGQDLNHLSFGVTVFNLESVNVGVK